MQEIFEVSKYLDGAYDHHRPGRDVARQGGVHHEQERNESEEDRQDEADQIRATASVGSASTAMHRTLVIHVRPPLKDRQP